MGGSLGRPAHSFKKMIMAEKELDKSVGTLKILEILPKDKWIEQTKLARCDIYKKDGLIKDYTETFGRLQHKITTETKALKKLEKEWKKAGGVDLLYESYVANTQAANLQAQTGNKDNWIDYNKGKSDVKLRPVYLIGGAILLVIIVLIKNKK